MRITKSAVIALLSGLAMLCFGTAGASAQTFTFQVCNQTGYKASVAIDTHPAVGDNRFQVMGWWVVAPHTCSTIGTFPQGWFYYYAEASEGDWHGNEISLCVQNPGPFSRINTPGYTCAANEDLVGFNGRLIDSSGTFTWNLQP